MIKQKIKFTDLDGLEREEEHLFHLNKAELTELEVSEDGGFVETVQEIIDAEDHKEIIRLFKKVILLAYGERVGDRFVKDEQKTQEFSQTEAYAELFVMLFQDEGFAANFMNGVLPVLPDPPPQAN